MDASNATLQILINVGFTLFGLVFVVLLNSIFKRISDLNIKNERTDANLNNLKVEVASKYIAKPDFQYLIDALFAKLEKIEEKIDRKQDK